MSHKLLIGLEFDGEYDPRVRAELEQLVAGLQTWQVNTSPNDAEYVVGSASTDLTNERVATSSPTIRVDRGSAGLIQWHANQAAFGAGYVMGLAGGEEGSDGPPGRDGAAGAAGATGPQGPMPAVLVLDGQDGEDCWIPGPQGVQGAAGTSGKLVQVVNTETGAVNTGTTTIPADDTIPQITEGTEFMTLAITPTSSTNKLLIQVKAQLACATANRVIAMALFQDATTDALATATQEEATASLQCQLILTHFMTAGTTSSTTFRIRAGVQTSGTVTFNGSAGSRLYGGTYNSSMTISEITP